MRWGGARQGKPIGGERRWDLVSLLAGVEASRRRADSTHWRKPGNRASPIGGKSEEGRG